MGRQTTRSVRKRETGRLRRRLAGSVLMALAAAVLVAPAASAAPEPIGSSELHWGIKSGFRSYITDIAAGTITASDGAAKEGSGASAPYLWSGDGGSYDPAANAGTIKMPGGQSRWSAGKDLSWEPLRLERVCEVKYDHLQGRRFRHAATFLRWRPDKRPQACRFDQLEVTTPYDLSRVFGAGQRRRNG